MTYLNAVLNENLRQGNDVSVAEQARHRDFMERACEALVKSFEKGERIELFKIT